MSRKCGRSDRNEKRFKRQRVPLFQLSFLHISRSLENGIIRPHLTCSLDKDDLRHTYAETNTTLLDIASKIFTDYLRIYTMQLTSTDHISYNRISTTVNMDAPTITPKFLTKGNELGLVAVGFSGGQVSPSTSYSLPHKPLLTA